MILTEHYDNLAERDTKIALLEGQGLRMLHDDFDAGWKHGKEPRGTMTFTDVIPPSPIIIPPRNLAAEIDEIKTIQGEIKAKLKERGIL